jgi:hypothetical protein
VPRRCAAALFQLRASTASRRDIVAQWPRSRRLVPASGHKGNGFAKACPQKNGSDGEPTEFANFIAVSYAGCSPWAGGSATAGASTGSAETMTGSCSGAPSTAGAGRGAKAVQG